MLNEQVAETSDDRRLVDLLVDAAPDGIVLVGRDTRIRYANSSVARLLGHDPKQLVGQSLDVLLPERFRGRHEALVARFLDQPELRPMGTARGIFGQHTDGHEIPLDIKLAPVPEAQGGGAVAVIRDITHRIEAEEQVKRYSLQLERVNGELRRLLDEHNRFLGVAAHDLRNPLSAVMAYADMMLAGLVGPLSHEQRQPVATILESAEFMHSMVNDLLSLTRLKEGRLELRKRRTDLSAVVEDSLRLQRPLAERKQIRFDVVVPGDVVLDLDEPKIRQVVQNLLSNAVKFSPAGTTVSLRLLLDGDRWLLQVSDQGVGIPAEEHHLVFEPFQRTSARPTAGEPSTGLGLWICRQIVEGHDGELDFDSEPGVGSTFRVRLPAS